MLPAYQTIKQLSEVQLEINKSLFIAAASPVENETAAVAFINHIKQRHRDATHNCSAYVIGARGEQQKADDDGEPSGTAGRPILEVLHKAAVKNAVIIVTRYFGGIKLGAGGLVRAYTQAAAGVLKTAIVIQKKLHDRLTIEVDYALLGTLENQLRLNGYQIEKKEYGAAVKLTTLVCADENSRICQQIADWTSAQAIIHEAGQCYLDCTPEQ